MYSRPLCCDNPFGVLTVFALQLVVLEGDGGDVQSPLWVPDLHSPQLETFLKEASDEMPQV